MARPTVNTVMLVLVALFVAACGSTQPTPTPASTATPTPTPTIVTFTDGNLEVAIRDALGKPRGEEITAAELATLTELNVPSRHITNLSGIQYGTNLTVLYLRINQIRDISPLASLTKLTQLDLHTNRISDF